MKLETKLNLKEVSSKVIEFDENKYLVGKNYISDLYDTILSKPAQARTSSRSK